MNWLTKELRENEEVIFRTRSYRILGIPAVITILGLIHLLFLFAGLLSAMYVAIRYVGNEYIITNQRVIIKKGFFDTRIETIAISLIEDVLIRGSYYDKIIRGGTIIIVGKEIDTQRLAGMDKPVTFRDALYSQIPASTLSYYEEA